MHLIAVFMIALLKGNEVIGIDSNSLFPRVNCYPEEQEGCSQELTDAYPNVSMSASNLTAANTYFWLFTRKNPDKPEKLHKCGGKLPPITNYNPNNRLIVIFNAFLSGHCEVAAYREWVVQILIREDANVMLVDDSWGNRPDYVTATLNLKIVAEQTVIVLNNIKHTIPALDPSRIYMIGHSHGAQLAGIVGYLFPGIGRITGIDPAGPGFAKNKTSEEDRLDPTDADLVDVWHTNGGDCLPQLGINYDAGHVDFYINGGHIQLACLKYGVISLLKRDFVYGIGLLVITDMCHHAFASEYFKVSINPGNCQFVGVKCPNETMFNSGNCNECGSNGENCMLMGFDLDKHFTKSPDFRQRYYVKTRSEDCPYCITESEVQLQGFCDTYKDSLQSQNSALDLLDL